MTWNYRIIIGDSGCALHEVHYDNAGKVVSWTERPRELTGECPEDVEDDLEKMLADVKRFPPLRSEEMPGNTSKGSGGDDD
jgi:hypothetical protein